MQIELKFLLPFIPYGLEAVHYFQDKELIREVNVNNVMSFVNGDSLAKPIFRPLSELIEPEDSNRMNYIQSLVNATETHCDAYDEWLESYISDPMPSRIMQAPYEVLLGLFGNHFDVFDLISKGLAVDINTLKIK